MNHKYLMMLMMVLLTLSEAHAQSPDTAFIRQDKNFDDTLIYVIDTVIFNSGMTKHILIGTTVMPSTSTQIAAYEYGIYLERVMKTECRGDENEAYVNPKPDRISNFENTDTSLKVEVQLTDNCCYDFLCDFSVDSTGTLHLLYKGYGTYCSCECCFGLTFYFNKMSDPEYAKVKAVMIGNSGRTIKKLEE